MQHLQASNPQMIVTANIGCLMHLQKGNKTPVKHWVELLNPM
jgi:glycolate oxidase iron-sulfur subunit